MGDERPGQAGDGARHDEREQRRQAHVDAERRGDPRVLPQGEQRPPALAAHHPPVDVEHDGEEPQAQVVVAPLGVEPVGLRGTLSRAAAGELLDLEDVLLGDEAVGQRDQREVEATDAQRHAAEDERLGSPDGCRGEHADPERLSLHGDQVGRREGADADERGVAERDLTDVAEEHVQREGDDPVAGGDGVQAQVGAGPAQRQDEHEVGDGRPQDGARPASRAPTAGTARGGRRALTGSSAVSAAVTTAIRPTSRAGPGGGPPARRAARGRR